MTTLKVESSPGKAADSSLELHVPGLYADPARRIVAIVEFQPTERVVPAPGSEKEPSVKVRISQCEVPDAAQVDAVREAMRALYLHRTARGTIDEEGELKLADRTVDLLAGALHEQRAVELVAGLHYWQEYAAVLAARQPAAVTVTQLLDEWRVAREGLRALALGRPVPKDVEAKAAKILAEGPTLLDDLDDDAADDGPGPLLVAEYAGKCPECGEGINPGDSIRMHEGQAHHDDCLAEV